MKRLKRLFKRLFNFWSPCCDETMITVFDMEHDRMLYTCSKCGKEYI